MPLVLVKAAAEYKPQIMEMMEEWSRYNRENPEANTSPWVIFKNDYHNFEEYIAHFNMEQQEEGIIPDSTFFCLDTEQNKMVGALQIRHRLNDFLLQYGGHIGDGIRPSERRKGYGTQMLALGLEKCKSLGISRVLMVCSKNNIGSAKVIQRNGGVLENEVCHEGQIKQRYWITL